MPSVFDGMTGVLNAVFGAPVLYLPAGGAAVGVQSVFREAPIEQLTEDGGSVWSVTPVWIVPNTEVVARGIARGDQIEPGNGKRYILLKPMTSGSPADDRFITFSLELVA